jgi:hypothetical protein
MPVTTPMATAVCEPMPSETSVAKVTATMESVSAEMAASEATMSTAPNLNDIARPVGRSLQGRR